MKKGKEWQPLSVSNFTDTSTAFWSISVSKERPYKLTDMRRRNVYISVYIVSLGVKRGKNQAVNKNHIMSFLHSIHTLVFLQTWFLLSVSPAERERERVKGPKTHHSPSFPPLSKGICVGREHRNEEVTVEGSPSTNSIIAVIIMIFDSLLLMNQSISYVCLFLFLSLFLHPWWFLEPFLDIVLSHHLTSSCLHFAPLIDSLSWYNIFVWWYFIWTSCLLNHWSFFFFSSSSLLLILFLLPSCFIGLKGRKFTSLMSNLEKRRDASRFQIYHTYNVNFRFNVLLLSVSLTGIDSSISCFFFSWEDTFFRLQLWFSFTHSFFFLLLHPFLETE